MAKNFTVARRSKLGHETVLCRGPHIYGGEGFFSRPDPSMAVFTDPAMAEKAAAFLADIHEGRGEFRVVEASQKEE